MLAKGLIRGFIAQLRLDRSDTLKTLINGSLPFLVCRYIFVLLD